MNVMFICIVKGSVHCLKKFYLAHFMTCATDVPRTKRNSICCFNNFYAYLCYSVIRLFTTEKSQVWTWIRLKGFLRVRLFATVTLWVRAWIRLKDDVLYLRREEGEFYRTRTLPKRSNSSLYGNTMRLLVILDHGRLGRHCELRSGGQIWIGMSKKL